MNVPYIFFQGWSWKAADRPTFSEIRCALDNIFHESGPNQSANSECESKRPPSLPGKKLRYTLLNIKCKCNRFKTIFLLAYIPISLF